jgi:hypothetical protein
LLLETRDVGYTGGLSHLGRLLADWRRTGDPVTVDAATVATPILVDPLTGHRVSPIVAAGLCVKSHGLLTQAQALKVCAFKAISPTFASMRALAMRLRGIRRGGDIEKLTDWLHDADRLALYGIYGFSSVRRDIIPQDPFGSISGMFGSLRTMPQMFRNAPRRAEYFVSCPAMRVRLA